MSRPDPLATANPVGVRDLGPDAARAFLRQERSLLDALEGAGYAPVVTPTFELAAVFERGLGPVASDKGHGVLRFVDPQNGEVLALRSDITPQIARLVAGPMRHVPAPLRLCYAGRVFRLRQHVEFQHREIAQAGAELLGESTAEADTEVLSVCTRALRATGAEPVFLLGHSQVLEAALGAAPPEELVALMQRKDRAGVAGWAREHAPAAAPLLPLLIDLTGPAAAILAQAPRLSARCPALAAPLERLSKIAGALAATPAAPRVLVDLAAVAGFGYYTGFVFHAFVEGAGVPVAGGGRYDTLIGRYGRDLCAAGFAIDGEALAEAGGATCLAS